MEYPFARKISIETWMKELNRVIMEKSVWQHLEVSILFALFDASMWEFQNDMFHQVYFQNKVVFFITEKTRIVKKTDPKKPKRL